MWIEMNSLNLELYTNTKTKKVTTTPQAAPVQNAQPEVEQNEAPSTDLSLKLQKFQQKVKEAPMVNEQKVNALKQQIS
ncbi:MAG TPA: flagellar biosynthesis anti-sigma factor FlgM, partial [Candidatus Berkiella sp.]|nr:flagellar biosynthesis anti-sigma factor FlgM [Candidatus Berkiella sp.]